MGRAAANGKDTIEERCGQTLTLTLNLALTANGKDVIEERC